MWGLYRDVVKLEQHHSWPFLSDQYNHRIYYRMSIVSIAVSSAHHAIHELYILETVWMLYQLCMVSFFPIYMACVKYGCSYTQRLYLYMRTLISAMGLWNRNKRYKYEIRSGGGNKLWSSNPREVNDVTSDCDKLLVNQGTNSTFPYNVNYKRQQKKQLVHGYHEKPFCVSPRQTNCQ